MVAKSVRWYEGKIMASDGCGSGFRQGCCEDDQRDVLGFR